MVFLFVLFVLCVLFILTAFSLVQNHRLEMKWLYLETLCFKVLL